MSLPNNKILKDIVIFLPLTSISTGPVSSCYGPSVTSASVTKAGLAGTDQRDRRGRTMGRGLSESRGSVQYVST